MRVNKRWRLIKMISLWCSISHKYLVFVRAIQVIIFWIKNALNVILLVIAVEVPHIRSVLNALEPENWGLECVYVKKATSRLDKVMESFNNILNKYFLNQDRMMIHFYQTTKHKRLPSNNVILVIHIVDNVWDFMLRIVHSVIQIWI